MERSDRFNFWLPSNDDVADVQQLVENFRIIDEKAAQSSDIPPVPETPEINSESVLYVEQELTPDQQAQARENIGAVGVETFEAEMGIMSDVLDELHNYAQALIGGEA